MKYCKDCVGFDECKASGRTVDFAVDDGVCIDFEERKPITNADRIRAMSDEELAKHFSGIICDINEGVEYHESRNIWLEWLKEPAEVE